LLKGSPVLVRYFADVQCSGFALLLSLTRVKSWTDPLPIFLRLFLGRGFLCEQLQHPPSAVTLSLPLHMTKQGGCSHPFDLGSSSLGAGSRVSAALGRLAGVCLYQHINRKN